MFEDYKLGSGKIPYSDSNLMFNIHPLFTLRLTQNFGSLVDSFDVYIPISFPRDYMIASAWAWCSIDEFLKTNYVGETKLFGLSGLNLSTQFCSMHVPHSGMNGESISLLSNASLFSPLKKNKFFPTLPYKDNVPPPSTIDLEFSTIMSLCWGVVRAHKLCNNKVFF